MTDILLALALLLGSIVVGAVPNAPSGGNPPPPTPPSVSDDANVSR